MKKISFYAVALAAFISMNSFTNVPTVPKTPEAKAAAVAELITNASKDGIVEFKEIKQIFSAMKGSKLNVAEKAVLKMNKKKIANSLESYYFAGTKSQLTATLLCFFVGFLGIHRFYMGYTWQGVVQLLTLGGLGIWSLIDFIRILIGDLKPKSGEWDKSFND